MTLECVTGLTTKINPKTMRMLDAAHHAPHAAIQQYSNTAIQQYRRKAMPYGFRKTALQ
uniref:hypothetical protein n=1 Tax=Bifidobacterium longum TaxID=216816 RepID=UPI003BAB01AF